MTPPPSQDVCSRVALLGSPNSGKTTLFNALTGLKAKTGNYPGVTVDRRTGRAKTPNGLVALVDLPGTYSLHAISEDEAVAVRVLKGEMPGEPELDGIVIVADATSLQRSLPFISEAMLLGKPCFLVCTMVDELKARGGEIDLFALRAKLGIPVLGVVGNRGIGIDDLRAQLGEPENWSPPKDLPANNTEARFAWADKILKEVTRKPAQSSQLTRKLDSVLLHPVLGGLIFLAFITAFFQAIFSWATPAMDALDGLVNSCADWAAMVLPESWLSALISDGIIRGVGAVIVFVPQIALLFALVFVFEACGYMARAAFVMDRIMGWVGLEGRCFIALLSSYACSVPGIMATRTIPSPRDRLATILVAPLMTCSARLPVYALLISAFIPATPIFGPLTLQGLTLMGLYFLGAFSALIFAAIFKRGLLRGATLPFYLELPPYRFPSAGSVAKQVWRRIKMFLRRAGTVILGVSILLWFLLNYPKVDTVGLSDVEAQQIQVEQSYAADLGRSIEPILSPMDWDWRVGIGLIGSFAAREVIVSTMAQVYAEDESELRLPLSLPSGIALLIFFVYALQCISTVVVIAREANGWKYAIFAISYQTGFAWLAAWASYLILA